MRKESRFFSVFLFFRIFFFFFQIFLIVEILPGFPVQLWPVFEMLDKMVAPTQQSSQNSRVEKNNTESIFVFIINFL